MTETRTKANAAAGKTKLKQSEVDELLDNLYEIYTKLDALDPVKMGKKENEAWTEQYTAVTRSIRVLENKELAKINAQLSENAGTLVKAIDAAENALHGLQDKAKILETVGNVLKFVAAIASII